jgi:hypothetical protein
MIAGSAYGVKSNGNGTASLGLLGLTSVVNDRLVVLVRAVGEVHANNVETGFAGVSLGALTPSRSESSIPVLSMLMASGELVLGPASCQRTFFRVAV